MFFHDWAELVAEFFINSVGHFSKISTRSATDPRVRNGRTGFDWWLDRMLARW
jgi:hypothetical protein